MRKKMDVTNVIEALAMIEQDRSVPKNVRLRVREAINSLSDNNGKAPDLKIDEVLQHLDILSDDPNLPPYTRTQIWSVVSTLESTK